MKSKKLFRSLFAEKLIELGNVIIAALVLSQFISDKKFSINQLNNRTELRLN